MPSNKARNNDEPVREHGDEPFGLAIWLKFQSYPILPMLPGLCDHALTGTEEVFL